MVLEVEREIATMPELQRHRVGEIAQTLTTFLRDNGPEAYMALALLGAKVAARGVV